MTHGLGHGVDDQQNDPTHQQRYADHHRRLIEHLLDEIARQHPRDHRRQAGEDHRHGEMPGIGLARQRIADQHRQLGEIDGYDSKNSAELDQDDEAGRLRQPEEMPGQQQVAGRTYRQELGEPLDDPENERNEKALLVHVPSPVSPSAPRP